MNNLVTAANARNLFVLGRIGTCPSWANLNGSGLLWTQPRNAADYATFCATVAQRYKGKIDAYEIWNEPNGKLFFGPAVSPAFYTSMVNGGVLAQTGSLGGNLSANDFLTGCYQNGFSGSCDAVVSSVRLDVLQDTRRPDAHRRHRNAPGHRPAPTDAGQWGRRQEAVGDRDRCAHRRKHHPGDTEHPEATSTRCSAYPVFSQNADPAIGVPVGPVYLQSHGYAQDCETGTRYATNNGWISSQTAIATIARAWNLVPLGPFANGMQDMDINGGFRVYTRTDLGTHAVYGAILAAWTTRHGLPKTDQYQPSGTNSARIDFEFASITWTSSGGPW